MWEHFTQYAQKRELIRLLSEKTGAPAGVVFIIVLVVVVGLLLHGGIGTYIILFLSFVYPAYLTFKALKDPAQAGLNQWGKYWVTISLIACLYQLLEWLISDVPFIGVVWCLCSYLLVRANGKVAIYLYDSVIEPLFGKYGNYIDSHLEALESQVAKEEKDMKDMGQQMKAKVVDAAMQKLTS